jgi:hypothetical protein
VVVSGGDGMALVGYRDGRVADVWRTKWACGRCLGSLGPGDLSTIDLDGFSVQSCSSAVHPVVVGATAGHVAGRQRRPLLAWVFRATAVPASRCST